MGKIEERVKGAVVGVVECDLSKEEIFPEDCPARNLLAQILICSLVFDVVCTDSVGLEVVMGRALKSLAPDGLLLMQGSLGEQIYAVGSAALPVLNIDEATLMQVFSNLSLEVVRW